MFNAVIIIFVYIACDFIVCNYIFALLSNTTVASPKTKGGGGEKLEKKTHTWVYDSISPVPQALFSNSQPTFKAVQNLLKIKVYFFKFQPNIQVYCSMFTQ